MFHRTFLAALTLMVSTAMAAPPVAMFVSKAINLDVAQADAFGAVCAAKYAEVNQSQVVAPAQARSSVGSNGSLVDAAKTLQSSELVELTLVNLASGQTPGRLLVNAVRRSVDGAEIFRTDVTAESLDDAVPVCERMALSLSRKVPVAETMNRHNVTAAEVKASEHANRTGTEKILGVKTSFGLPFAASPINPIATLAFDARFERERYFIEVGAGFLIPAVVSSSNASFGGLTSEIGASYYLTAGDTAPYIGGGIQPRLVFSGSVWNLAPYAQLGVMFSRQSSMRIYADARLSQNLLPVTNAYPSSGAGALYPTEVVAQVGIGW